MRILFIGMPESIHVARWVDLLADQGWDLHFYPVNCYDVHSGFRNITVHRGVRGYRDEGVDASVRICGWWPFLHGSGPLMRLFPMQGIPNPVGLARLIRRLNPDILHSMEFQHAGYMVLDALPMLQGCMPPWIATNWGSDIYLFGRLPEHRERIRGVLAHCNYYVCEGERDVRLAREFGFQGQVGPVIPATGGYDLEQLSWMRTPGPSSARRVIMIKGYQHFAGRALVGLKAISMCADALAGYEVVVYLATPDVELAARLLAIETGLKVTVLPKVPHEEMLRLHGRARISIGLSISDAISTSFLEAIAMGSFPIQSNTSMANEWIEDGQTGLLVSPEDPQVVAEALRKALRDDAQVDAAAETNWKTVSERLERLKIRGLVTRLYEDVLKDRRVPGAKDA